MIIKESVARRVGANEIQEAIEKHKMSIILATDDLCYGCGQQMYYDIRKDKKGVYEFERKCDCGIPVHRYGEKIRLIDIADMYINNAPIKTALRFCQYMKIRLATEAAIEFTASDAKKYNSAQQGQLLSGLAFGVNVYEYADEKYNGKQMGVIKTALVHGIDIEIFRNHKVSGVVMQMKLDAIMELGWDVVKDIVQADYNKASNELYLLCVQLKMPYNQYTHKKFTNGFKMCMSACLRKGLDHEFLMTSSGDPKFSNPQYGVIRKGVIAGVDYREWAKATKTPDEMEIELKLQLEKRREDDLKQRSGEE